MNLECRVCAINETGSEDYLTSTGWTHVEGKIDGKRYGASWCKNCFKPNFVPELLLQVQKREPY